MIGVIVLVLILVVGAAVAAVALGLFGTSSSELELDVQRCEIATDGSLSASGTIASRGGESDVILDIRFLDVDGGDVVDTDRITVVVPADAAERWRGTGSAPDEVQQVTCEVTAEG